MSHILCTGIATLDIINSVSHYPAEDEEMRATAQRMVRGGNAANTACVLAQFGHRVDFAGVLADDLYAEKIKAELAGQLVSIRYCPVIEGAVSPVSSITLNSQNGSRTIVHYRDLPELDFTQFRQMPVAEFDWLHFEGRNIDQTRQMLIHAREDMTDQPVSLEMEKHRPDIESLYPLADILIFSRQFVLQQGYESARAFSNNLRKTGLSGILVFPWGEQGAWAYDSNDNEYKSPAFPPDKVVDTLGAGDTFNAGLINALASGEILENALQQACQIAGKKTGQAGFANLAKRNETGME